MARTVTEIQQAIKADFVANSTLADMYQLDQSRTYDEQLSAVSVESLIIYIVAMATHLLERLMDTFQTEVEERMATQRLMSIAWYYRQCLAYQHGDALTFSPDTYRYGYASADASKQIVQFAAVRQVQVDGVTKLRIFVSRASKAQLSQAELTAFTAYMAQVGAAGVHLDVQSGPPDELNLTMQVIYNPLVLDSTGARLDGTASAPVTSAISSFVDSLEYGGTLNRSKLVDAVQAVEGVEDVILISLSNGDTLVTGQNAVATYGSFRCGTLSIDFTPNIS